MFYLIVIWRDGGAVAGLRYCWSFSLYYNIHICGRVERKFWHILHLHRRKWCGKTKMKITKLCGDSWCIHTHTHFMKSIHMNTSIYTNTVWRTKRVHFHYEWMHFLVKMYMCGFRRLRISEAKWSKVNTKTSTFYLVGWLGGWMETSLIKAKLHNEAQRAHQHAYPITFTYASHGNLILFFVHTKLI